MYLITPAKVLFFFEIRKFLTTFVKKAILFLRMSFFLCKFAAQIMADYKK